MSATMMAPLSLSRSGDGWLLQLSGDWSLRAMPSIEAQLENLPGLEGTLICDWTHAESPGISPAWAFLRRLAELRASPQPDVRPVGNPPHSLDLLQKLHVYRSAAHSQAPPATLERLVGKLGRWAVLQGRHG